ncbi:MAG: ribosome biogenesis protein [Nitrososphaeraceae archaeon]
MYSLVIVEAAIELVPQTLRNHPSVKNHCKRVGRDSSEILLDISYHHRAMVEQNIKQWWKRGRPDIVHFDLVEALSTPLFKEKKLHVYVSTFDNKLLIMHQDLRLPKNYLRFERLMISIFNKHRSKEASDLIEFRDNVSFTDLVQKIIKPQVILGFSVTGTRTKLSDILHNNQSNYSKDYCFVVGGFQRGHFSESITRLCNSVYSISPFSLESHVVIARLLYECENYG